MLAPASLAGKFIGKTRERNRRQTCSDKGQSLRREEAAIGSIKERF
jgi:hypothetical protein